MTVQKLTPGHISGAMKHVLFLCSREKKYSSPLNEYTRGKEMVKIVCVPGNLHHIMLHRECTEFSINTISLIMEWLLGLHSKGFSFDGNFTSRHLHVTASGQIKMLSSQKRFLKHITIQGKKLDKQQIAEIIEEVLSGVNLVPQSLPHDILHLIELLRNGIDGDDIVLAKHPGPMTGIQKLLLFILMFAQMETIKIRNPEKYRRIVKSLPFGNREWIRRIKPLKYLMRIFNYKNRSRSYPVDASGMLLLERNGLAHLIEDHSITVKVRRLKVKGLKAKKKIRHVNIHFTYNQISHMFSYACPQLIPKLQLSLHREGEFRSIYKTE